MLQYLFRSSKCWIHKINHKKHHNEPLKAILCSIKRNNDSSGSEGTLANAWSSLPVVKSFVFSSFKSPPLWWMCCLFCKSAKVTKVCLLFLRDNYQGLQTGSLLSGLVLTPTGLTALDPPEKDVMPWTGEGAGGAELLCTGLALSATGTPAFA